MCLYPKYYPIVLTKFCRLVATLGQKSGTKKVSRKAILGVNVQKACETIGEPEAPIALRLQGNLLYGVVRVNNQKAEYLLTDAQSAQNSMRAMIKLVRSNRLDTDASKARPDQIMVMDDPAFLLDNALNELPALDFDFELNGPTGDSQRSSQSMLSIRGHSGSISSQHSSNININLSLPSSNASIGLPFNDPFGGSSAQKPGGVFGDEEELILHDNDLFDFGDDGQIHDIPASERQARSAGSVHPRDSGADERVRKEHEDAIAGRILPIIDGEGDFDMNFGDDILPDAEAFPVMSGGLGLGVQPRNLNDEDHVFSESPEASSVFAEAKQRKTRTKRIKSIAADSLVELHNSDIGAWQHDYIDNMAANTLAKTNHKAAIQAKKNAFHFVYGIGINGIGDGMGSSNFISPLAQFSGAALLATLTGAPATKKAKRKTIDNDSDTPNKAARTSELGRGQNFEDDGLNFNMDDDPFAVGNQSLSSHSVEIGRDAPSALADYPSSAMPWNMSASANSHQRALSSLSKLPGSRRLTAASPLMGRGSTLPGELENFSQAMDVDFGDEEMVMYGRSDSVSGYGNAGGYSSSQVGGLVNPGEEFENFGPAAFVDTQTAGNSQWVKSALDRESNNFLEYVKNTISEKEVDELSGDNDTQAGIDDVFGAGNGKGKGKATEDQGSVTFEELFQEGKHSKVVASQAFYHILCLATRNLVWVDQDVEKKGNESTGEIYVSQMGTIRLGVIDV